MFAALALSLVPILAGALLTYLYDQNAPLAARLATGVCTGYALFATLGFLLALLLGLQPITLVLTEVALASPLASLARPAFRSQVRREAAAAAGAMTFTWFVFYALLSLLLWLVFYRALFERPDGVYTGLTHNLGGLPFHFQAINSFFHSRNFSPGHPTYARRR